MLYHGSYAVIDKPDLAFSRLRTDFGKGFYLTPLKEQAMDWSLRFLLERGAAVVSCYELLLPLGDRLPADARILEFDTYSVEWLDFIMACRLGQPVDTEWDIVIGGVAHDKVFDTIQLSLDRLIGAGEANGRLRYSKPNLQYCFKTQAIIDKQLLFRGSEVIE
jgi:hypothetical protein